MIPMLSQDGPDIIGVLLFIELVLIVILALGVFL